MLDVEALQAGYGARPVLDALSLTVAPGEAVALLGRNGAGKTTTLKSVLGLVPARARRLAFFEDDLRPLSPDRRARLGIAYAAQDGRLFPDMSVAENLRLGGGRDAALLDDLLDRFPQLAGRLRQRAGTLSGGEQQVLGLVRALWAKPRLLLMDEPGEGLMPALLEAMGGALRAACDNGAGLLVAEQRVNWVRAWCDRAVVLARGEVVFEWPFALLTPELERHHLGLF